MTKLISIAKPKSSAQMVAKQHPKSSAQIVAKQHMKKYLKRIRNREYGRLRDMVPTIANKQNISKVTVIEEAVRYIDELHRALASRLTNTELTGINGSEDILMDIVHSFIPTHLYERRAPPMLEFEKQQKIPSYLTQNRNKRPARLV